MLYAAVGRSKLTEKENGAVQAISAGAEDACDCDTKASATNYSTGFIPNCLLSFVIERPEINYQESLTKCRLPFNDFFTIGVGLFTFNDQRLYLD
jgi:hypothetical protein